MIKVGTIINTHGLKGECKIYLVTDDVKDRFAKGRILHLSDGRKLTVSSFRMQKGFGYATVSYTHLWVSREISIYIVSFLLLFPIFYQNLFEAIQDISQSWKDIFQIYPQSWFKKMQMVYLPLLRPAMASSWITCSSLGFKVVVMAEIMTSVSLGIGANMQYDRLDVYKRQESIFEN